MQWSLLSCTDLGEKRKTPDGNNKKKWTAFPDLEKGAVISGTATTKLQNQRCDLKK